MYDGGKIIIGLVIGIGLLLSPFIYNAGTAAKAPEPVLSEKAKQAGECVDSKSYMRRWHMQLLDEWRNSAVRDGKRFYRPKKKAAEVSLEQQLLDQWRHFVSDGTRRFAPKEDKVYTMSLQLACMDCHSNKAKFCDECHNYMGVTPYCWECHIEPKEEK